MTLTIFHKANPCPIRFYSMKHIKSCPVTAMCSNLRYIIARKKSYGLDSERIVKMLTHFNHPPYVNEQPCCIFGPLNLAIKEVYAIEATATSLSFVQLDKQFSDVRLRGRPVTHHTHSERCITLWYGQHCNQPRALQLSVNRQQQ